MNAGLRVLHVLLAAVFLAHGWLFLAPPASVVEQMNASLPRWSELGMASYLAHMRGRVLPIPSRHVA